jgi:predicted glycosyltransferase
VDELTTGGSQYSIGFSGQLPAAAEVEAHAMVMNFTVTGDTIRAECTTTAELNRIIDLLRKHGVEIASITRQRNTLEESFISLIKREVAP